MWFNFCAFVYRKLHDLIEAEDDWLIEWAPHGECFFIRDVDEFCARVLAKYFRHTKLTSFQVCICRLS